MSFDVSRIQLYHEIAVKLKRDSKLKYLYGEKLIGRVIEKEWMEKQDLITASPSETPASITLNSSGNMVKIPISEIENCLLLR